MGEQESKLMAYITSEVRFQKEILTKKKYFFDWMGMNQGSCPHCQPFFSNPAESSLQNGCIQKQFSSPTRSVREEEIMLNFMWQFRHEKQFHE